MAPVSAVLAIALLALSGVDAKTNNKVQYSQYHTGDCNGHPIDGHLFDLKLEKERKSKCTSVTGAGLKFHPHPNQKYNPWIDDVNKGKDLCYATLYKDNGCHGSNEVNTISLPRDFGHCVSLDSNVSSVQFWCQPNDGHHGIPHSSGVKLPVTSNSIDHAGSADPSVFTTSFQAPRMEDSSDDDSVAQPETRDELTEKTSVEPRGRKHNVKGVWLKHPWTGQNLCFMCWTKKKLEVGKFKCRAHDDGEYGGHGGKHGGHDGEYGDHDDGRYGDHDGGRYGDHDDGRYGDHDDSDHDGKHGDGHGKHGGQRGKHGGYRGKYNIDCGPEPKPTPVYVKHFKTKTVDVFRTLNHKFQHKPDADEFYYPDPHQFNQPPFVADPVEFSHPDPYQFHQPPFAADPVEFYHPDSHQFHQPPFPIDSAEFYRPGPHQFHQSSRSAEADAPEKRSPHRPVLLRHPYIHGVTVCADAEWENRGKHKAEVRIDDIKKPKKCEGHAHRIDAAGQKHTYTITEIVTKSITHDISFWAKPTVTKNIGHDHVPFWAVPTVTKTIGHDDVPFWAKPKPTVTKTVIKTITHDGVPFWKPPVTKPIDHDDFAFWAKPTCRPVTVPVPIVKFVPDSDDADDYDDVLDWLSSLNGYLKHLPTKFPDLPPIPRPTASKPLAFIPPGSLANKPAEYLEDKGRPLPPWMKDQ